MTTGGGARSHSWKMGGAWLPTSSPGGRTQLLIGWLRPELPFTHFDDISRHAWRDLAVSAGAARPVGVSARPSEAEFGGALV